MSLLRNLLTAFGYDQQEAGDQMRTALRHATEYLALEIDENAKMRAALVVIANEACSPRCKAATLAANCLFELTETREPR